MAQRETSAESRFTSYHECSSVYTSGRLPRVTRLHSANENESCFSLFTFSRTSSLFLPSPLPSLCCHILSLSLSLAISSPLSSLFYLITPYLISPFSSFPFFTFQGFSFSLAFHRLHTYCTVYLFLLVSLHYPCFHLLSLFFFPFLSPPRFFVFPCPSLPYNFQYTALYLAFSYSSLNYLCSYLISFSFFSLLSPPRLFFFPCPPLLYHLHSYCTVPCLFLLLFSSPLRTARASHTFQLSENRSLTFEYIAPGK